MKFKVTFVLALFVAAATVAAPAQQDIQVFVPGTASGCFGNPDDGCAPLVAALTVSGPGTITVTYVDGLVSWSGPNSTTGPNGTSCPCRGMQFPLKEAQGIGLGGGHVKNLGALFGVFVSQPRVSHSGFQAIDGTKNLVRVGIKPDDLFFIGAGRTFDVGEAGTLFLGINDTIVSDNGGGFTVEVTGP